MRLFAEVGIDSSEGRLLILVVTFVLAVAVFRLLRWLAQPPSQPEPWDDQVAQAIDREDATPICPRCLEPYDRSADFCLDCGAPVGAYTNWLPFPYIFSMGHLLRTGTSGEFKRTPLTVLGFFLLGIAEYACFAPAYWFMFLRNLGRQRPIEHPSPGSQAGDPR
jgi:hypothetical protein